MKLNCEQGRRPMMKLASGILGLTLAMLWSGPFVRAQSAPAATKTTSVETFYLVNVNELHEVNEVVVALRNILDPDVKIYLLPSQNAIVMRADPDQLMLAKKVLKDLDQPKRAYRLTYTIADTDAGKLVGTQHYSIIVVSGGRTTFKNGSKVPVLTGTTASGTTTSKTDFTYLDVGLNIDASLDESVKGVRLRTKVERSSVAEERASAGADDPVIRQTVLESTSILTPGKQEMLGSLDVPGSTRHLKLEAIVEVLP
jgi:type II secretory pathway component GspD/PulD (secretin)